MPVPGQNDVSCGARCTGSGPTDSIDCLLAAPGIPALAPAAFAYTTSNFQPSAFTPPSTSTTIDCDTTYDSSAHAFTAWCAGQTQPTISPGVAQANGPAVDVLAFRGLILAAGHTLKVTSTSGGGNAVIFAVYGSADIEGSIHADGSDGVSGTVTPGLSGPGGAFSCGGAAGTSQGTDNRCSAGGGGGASAAGGSGAGGVAGNAAAGGSARPNTGLQPLFGGCPGGTSGSWACRTSGGGGGGALQISASGELLVAGSITANGGNGGTSTCFASGCAANGYGGGTGGAGSGGAILLEGQSVVTTGSTITVNGGQGGFPNTDGGGGTAQGGQGGLGGTSAQPAGSPGTGMGSPVNLCASYTLCAGGGGGSYGYLKVNASDPAPCETALSPAPVANATLTWCVCVADSNCASGKCVNAGGQCSGACTGEGAADDSSCQKITSAATAWSCPAGNCENVVSPAAVCSAADVACFCTSDLQCTSGKCVDWAGCAAGACSGNDAGDEFHCAP